MMLRNGAKFNALLIAAVTNSLRKLLEIRNKAKQTVERDDVHAAKIKEYLDFCLT